MLTQIWNVGDVCALQSSTQLVVSITNIVKLSVRQSTTISKPEALTIDIIAVLWSIHSTTTKDFFAVHIAIRAISFVAEAFFSAWGSILQMKVTRTCVGGPRAVLWKVTYVHDRSAHGPAGGVGAICAALLFITNAPRGVPTVVLTTFIGITLLEGATVTVLLCIHYGVSTTVLYQGFVQV